MPVSASEVKELREMTSCGVIECKKALEEANGDFGKAKEILLKRGLEIAAKKSGRAATEGRVEAYLHNGNKIGVLVEVNCESDFVARSADFCNFTKELAMHIAAMNPRYVKRDDVPADVLVGLTDKEGYYKENCLLEQAFIRDSKKTIQDCLNGLVASIGENILIGRFVRFKVGTI